MLFHWNLQQKLKIWNFWNFRKILKNRRIVVIFIVFELREWEKWIWRVLFLWIEVFKPKFWPNLIIFEQNNVIFFENVVNIRKIWFWTPKFCSNFPLWRHRFSTWKGIFFSCFFEGDFKTYFFWFLVEIWSKLEPKWEPKRSKKREEKCSAVKGGLRSDKGEKEECPQASWSCYEAAGGVRADQDGPRSHQDGPRSAQEAPRKAQDRPRWPFLLKILIL